MGIVSLGLASPVAQSMPEDVAGSLMPRAMDLSGYEVVYYPIENNDAASTGKDKRQFSGLNSCGVPGCCGGHNVPGPGYVNAFVCDICCKGF